MSSTQFQDEFVTFQKELKSYLLRITGNAQDSEDLTQDTYIKAYKNLASFRNQSSLKTWVFSIATNLARDHLRRKSKWHINAQDNARKDAYERSEPIQKLQAIVEKSPHGKFVIKEHIDFCFTCISKTLRIDQQIALILKDVYGFKVAEIMQIMQLSEGKVKHAIADARKTMIQIFENRCALVNKTGVCHQCSELSGLLNPKQVAQEQLMKLQLSNQAKNGKSQKELFKLRLQLIKSIDPLHSEGTDLHNYILTLMPGYSKRE